MKRKLKNWYKKGRRIKPILGKPKVLLFIQGFLDSRKGEVVANTQIEFYISKCSGFVMNEILLTEEYTSPLRMEARDLISVIDASNIDTDSVKASYNDFSQIMLDKSNKSIQAAKRRLVTIGEELRSLEMIKQERILKTKNKGRKGIYAYLKGVQAGKLKDYSYEVVLPGDAEEQYSEIHKSTDESIYSIGNYIYERGM